MEHRPQETKRQLLGRRLEMGVLLAIYALGACATNPKPLAPQLFTISGRLPSLAALAETRELQEKGGLQVSVAPVSYEVRRSGESSDREIQPSFLERLSGPDGWQYMRFVERTHTAVLKTVPETLRFRVTINNQLSRVFRGAGTVVQFNVAGKLVPVDQSGYSDLSNMIVPPRTQQQVEVYGPPIASIPEGTTVALFLYDVVTKTDAAGNTTEKQNFEWFFNYATQVREETAERRVERLWLR